MEINIVHLQMKAALTAYSKNRFLSHFVKFRISPDFSPIWGYFLNLLVLYNWFLLLAVVMFYKFTTNTKLMNTEPLLLGETLSVSPLSHFYQLIYTEPCFYLKPLYLICSWFINIELTAKSTVYSCHNQALIHMFSP